MVGIIIASLALVAWQSYQGTTSATPVISEQQVKEKPLEKYSYDALKQRSFDSALTFDHLTASKTDFATWQFFFDYEGKKVSGVANLPKGVATNSAFTKPIIVLNRGFASGVEYYPGFGTQRVADALAAEGYITFAPDFLGYGDSDNPSSDVFEERFQRYSSVLSLLAGIEKNCSEPCPIGLWGHSNGGQVTLSVLIASGKPYPAVLWNPVTKSFPYSILYYIDSFADQGKSLRKVLSSFEEDYDADKYSIRSYLSDIKSPILLQQGGADDLVPQSWSNEFFQLMEEEATESSVNYITYNGADHNLVPSWNSAVTELIKFYNEHLK